MRIRLLWLAVWPLALGLPEDKPYRPSIPRTWDPKAMASLQVPLATSSASPVPASAEFYYGLPEMKILRSYPIYAPGREPAGYAEWLKQQEPELAFDPSRLRSAEDWKRAGETVFDAPLAFESDPFLGIVTRTLIRNPAWYLQAGIPVARDGVVPFARYVVRTKGVVEVGNLSCGMCHTRVMPDGSIIKGAQGNFPFDRTQAFKLRAALHSPKDAHAAALEREGWRFLFAAPWLRPDPLTRIDNFSLTELASVLESIPSGVLARHGSSPFSPVQVPDLIGVRERRYLDRTGLIRHRSIGDLMRYAALNQGGDDFSAYAGFVPAKLAEASPIRYSDEQHYALSLYLYSLQPPQNPHSQTVLTRRGKAIFEREGCGRCHTPPLYTNNRLTPVAGFVTPREHVDVLDILPVSVGTDPELALKTRRGTGYYKVPSLKGVWYREPLEHNGSVATLEDWFDPSRLNADYVPTGYRGFGVETRAVKGHEYGLQLSAEDKACLVAFLKTL
ncbi:MAG: hypothetical protein ACRD8O_12035 [Bryobacteraceae bacterium]